MKHTFVFKGSNINFNHENFIHYNLIVYKMKKENREK